MYRPQAFLPLFLPYSINQSSPWQISKQLVGQSDVLDHVVRARALPTLAIERWEMGHQPMLEAMSNPFALLNKQHCLI